MGGIRRVLESTETIGEAFREAYSEIEALCEEMSSWRDGLADTNFAGSAKYDEIEEAEDSLSSAIDELNCVEIPDDLLGLEVTFVMLKGKLSRPKRAIMVAARLQAIYDSLEESNVDAAGISGALSFLETVNFPRAFGG